MSGESEKTAWKSAFFEIAPFGQRSSPRFFGAVPEGWASRQRPEGEHLGGQRPDAPDAALQCQGMAR